MSGFEGIEEILKKLEEFKTGKSCLYINKLKDVDIPLNRIVVEGEFFT